MSTNVPAIGISGVCERDIDLLLVEEIAASGGFARWFLGEIGISKRSRVIAVNHSVGTASGESDIEIILKADGKAIKILVEDKLDAPFQREQPERYRQRANGYLRSGRFSEVRTVIVAPEEYLRSSRAAVAFDRHVSIEAILSHLEKDTGLGERARYKCALLRRSIERGNTGWRMVPDKAVSSFWQQYWELANAIATDLRMKRPSEKPAASAFVYFRPVALPSRVKLVHKLTHGRVDLQFCGLGGSFGPFVRRYRPGLPPGMQIEVAGKSAVIRLFVPKIDTTAPFARQETAVRSGLRAAKRLLRWCVDAGLTHAPVPS